MPAAFSQGRKSLTNLLAYAEEILKAGERIVSDLSRDAIVAFHEHDVVGLEGVSARSGDGCWLRIARLHESAPPEPDEAYHPWLQQQKGAAALDAPRLAETLLVQVLLEEASDLIEADLASADDVMTPRSKKAPDVVDVLLRLTNLPEFAAAFEAWLAGPWSAWAEAERPRRRSIAFYNRMFETQQRAASMGDDFPTEVVFGVGLARWNHPADKVNTPLIEALVELELDPEDGALVVRPREQAPRLALRPFDALGIDGVGKLQRDASALLDQYHADPDVGFSPHERAGFEAVLRMCHARLSADAAYEPDLSAAGRTPPKADGRLRITDTWVIYVRQRSANFRCDDIRRLSTAVHDLADDADLPAPALQMTMRPKDAGFDDEAVDLNNTVLRLPDAPHSSPTQNGSGGTARPTEAERTYFFPLPCNEDQIEIVRRLERPDVSGVVVQGPPGTGKTHTIANIIAHYMATGRRVLVSAHAPEALAAIQQKLPASIRDLAISVIHNDREGSRRLEQAVDILATQVKSIDKREYNGRRLDLERTLAETAAALVRTDAQIMDCARLNLAEVEYQGERLIPMELAARIEAERPLHAWFPDRIGTTARFDPRIGEADVADAKTIRRALAGDIIYSASQLPDRAALPDVPRLLAAHAALVRDGQSEKRSAAGDLPYVSLPAGSGMEQVRALRDWLAALLSWADAVCPVDAWLADLLRLLAGITPAHDATREGLLRLCTDWAALTAEGRVFTLRSIALPGDGSANPALDGALDALAEGRKPFGLFSFVKSPLKAQIEAVRLDGTAPDGSAGWSVVKACWAWQRRAHGFIGRWSGAAKAVGYPVIDGDWTSACAELMRLGGFVERMLDFHAAVPARLEIMAAVFPYSVDPRQFVFRFDIAAMIEALTLSLDKEGHAAAHDVRRRLEQATEAAALPFHGAVQGIAATLGDPAVQPQELAEAWREVLEEAARLDGLRGQRQRLEEVATLVAASGASTWAAALLRDQADDKDLWTPDGWRTAWNWARMDSHIRDLSDRGALADLSARRTALEDKQRAAMDELVRVRTFIGLKQGITERVASALTKFGMKVRQLGAGTGKAAERHRRAIREAALEAAAAVPCWILPEWRVAEQLPSELGLFDLVIIDEASQSDITSLPAVMRGKKLLIVGDDKQVSPLAVGMEERTVIQLRETFLRGMDIAKYLEPATSLYDLASMTFPGSVIMLREHFRCVEPIIAFSSRFYPKALIPLRVPTAAERLDPPLIDIFVPDGRKVRDVNEAEATVIVAEIARLVGLPEYAGRTLGVISLIGDKQAKLIQERLLAAVGTEAIAKHRITCGNASMFQGQERDVMFLSMVACPATVRAQTARLMEQRFNVAMSRARDRAYLVRSVAAAMLSPNDLKLAVIEHFRNPMGAVATAQPKDVLDACDSGFEREVGGRLLDLGYRVRPQVKVGAYRIDFVVEGSADRRLAIELDGDRYHGPDRWADDQRRQRALERLGWVFWRCWGSHWLADREGCLQDLLAMLERLGITPVGGEFSPQVWTEHRVAGEANAACGAAQAAAEAVIAQDAVQAEILAFSDPTPTLPTRNEVLAEIGDTVIVRFADNNRTQHFRLSQEVNDPDSGVANIRQAIGSTLLGNSIEEEVDLVVGGGPPRRVIIEKITKAA